MVAEQLKGLAQQGAAPAGGPPGGMPGGDELPPAPPGQ
jgi:hypothetical protein